MVSTPIREIVRLIPVSLREIVSNEFIKIVINSPNSHRIPSSLVRSLLYYWQRDNLSTEVGLAKLIEAALIVEYNKAIKILIDLGLNEAIRLIKAHNIINDPTVQS
jgi:hypothetical protein